MHFVLGVTYIIKERFAFIQRRNLDNFSLFWIMSKMLTSMLYIYLTGKLYIIWRGLLFVTNRQAVQSLGVVTANVPTPSFFINRFFMGAQETRIYYKMFNKADFICIQTGIYLEKGLEFNTPIYRYTNLLNFLLLLSNNLCIPLRKRFEDKLERYSFYNIFIADLHPTDYPVLKEEKERSRYLHEKLQEANNNLYTSCWTLETQENYLMWKSYTPRKGGIRIESTIKDFVNSIKENRFDIYIGKIKYSKSKLKKDIHEALFFKQEYYTNEQEIRFYFKRHNKENFDLPPLYYLNVNPKELINKITISPFIKIGNSVKIINELKNKYAYLENKITYSKIQI